MTATTAEENLGPQINAVLWVLLGTSGLFLALRLYCKILKSRGLWWDDYMLVASWLVFLVNVVCTTVSISLGFGRHVFTIDRADLPRLLILRFVSVTLSILAAVWSKTSFSLTLLRVTDGKVKLLVWFSIISMNLLMAIPALMPWIHCRPTSKAWYPGAAGQCWNPNIAVYFGVVATAYSGVMDVLLALLPWSFIWNLRLRSIEKFGVAAAMSMGIFAGCTAFVKCEKSLLLTKADFTYSGYGLVVWANAEISTTIMAASVPVLRSFIRRVRPPTPQLREYVSLDACQSEDTVPGLGTPLSTLAAAASPNVDPSKPSARRVEG